MVWLNPGMSSSKIIRQATTPAKLASIETFDTERYSIGKDCIIQYKVDGQRVLWHMWIDANDELQTLMVSRGGFHVSYTQFSSSGITNEHLDNVIKKYVSKFTAFVQQYPTDKQIDMIQAAARIVNAKYYVVFDGELCNDCYYFFDMQTNEPIEQRLRAIEVLLQTIPEQIITLVSTLDPSSLTVQDNPLSSKEVVDDRKHLQPYLEWLANNSSVEGLVFKLNQTKYPTSDAEICWYKLKIIPTVDMQLTDLVVVPDKTQGKAFFSAWVTEPKRKLEIFTKASITQVEENLLDGSISFIMNGNQVNNVSVSCVFSYELDLSLINVPDNRAEFLKKCSSLNRHVRSVVQAYGMNNNIRVFKVTSTEISEFKYLKVESRSKNLFMRECLFVRIRDLREKNQADTITVSAP